MAALRESKLVLIWTDKTSGQTKFVRFDVVSSETHEAAMDITGHPVEDGPDITDFARIQPRTLGIEAYVSNKPIWSNPGVEQLATFQSVKLQIPDKAGGAPIFTPGGLVSTIKGALTDLVHPRASRATVLKSDGDFPDRARAMFETLEQARIDRARIRVVTAIGEIENMLIEKIGVPRTTEDGNGANFQVDLKEVRIVRSETVSAPQPAEARGAALSSKGSKAVEKADAAKEEQLKSFLAQGADAGSELAGQVTGLFHP